MANNALELGEVPVGAVVLHHDTQISEAHNETVAKNDLTRHAELTAMRAAMKVLDVDRLHHVTLCVTLSTYSRVTDLPPWRLLSSAASMKA